MKPFNTRLEVLGKRRVLILPKVGTASHALPAWLNDQKHMMGKARKRAVPPADTRSDDVAGVKTADP
jgi:hypothetical protein